MKNLLDVPGLDEPYNAPRQILPPIYWQTGHIDAIRAATILERLDERQDDLSAGDRPALTRWISITSTTGSSAEWLAPIGGLEYGQPG